MYPDLILYRRGVAVLVADVKYKLSDEGLGRNTDYYQLLAYTARLDLDRGLLIYGSENGADGSAVLAADDRTLELFPVYLGDPVSTNNSLAALVLAVQSRR